MKTNLLHIFLFTFLIPSTLNAQEFSFQMYFEDAQGNRDTLTIGYDAFGSRDSIISEFGEENIAHIPFDPIFDVRITNQADINGAIWNYDFDLYHTKKKIVQLPCNEEYFWFQILPLANIDIMAKYWPVTIQWDESLFENDCHEGSLFTPWHANFWWDTGHYYSDFDRIVLKNNSELTFSANFPENWENHPIDNDFFTYYTDDYGNPVATFWLAFGYASLLSVNASDVINSSELKVFPNPTTGLVKFKNQNSPIKEILIYDTTGRQFLIENQSNKMDLSHLPDGLYLIKIIWMNGVTEIHKILKHGF